MKCPKCGGNTYVSDSRHRQGNYTYRHRVCTKCGEGFQTREIIFNRKEYVDKQAEEKKLAKAIDILRSIDMDALETV